MHARKILIFDFVSESWIFTEFKILILNSDFLF